jgi:N-acetylneuraminic acid mutarotase
MLEMYSQLRHCVTQLRNTTWLVLCLPLLISVPLTSAQAAGWAYTGYNYLNYFVPGSTTVLPNGKVLAIYNSQAALYTPGSGTWSQAQTPPYGIGQSGHTATVLSNGKILVAGGSVEYYYSDTNCALYDPATNSWTTTGHMNQGRSGHTATKLANNKVLVVGGGGYGQDNSAEIYDPATGKWSYTGYLAENRSFFATSLLNNGKVLVTGGCNYGYISYGEIQCYDPKFSAEVYDVATGQWNYTANDLSVPRARQTSTLLSNGKVLIAGGCSDNCGYIYDSISSATCDLYDPATNKFTPTSPMFGGRAGHSATVLNNGEVLVTGGYDDYVLDTSEKYNPTTGKWTKTNDMIEYRDPNHTAVKLSTGSVLVTGGGDYHYDATAEKYYGSTELYYPNAVPTVLELLSSSNPTLVGQPLNFTANVTATNSTPVGNVIFNVDANESQSMPINTGTVTYSNILLPRGTHYIKAVYTGNANFGSSKDYLVQEVLIPAPDLTITGINMQPAVPTANSTFNAEIEVKNQGTVDLADGSQLTVWANQNITQKCGATGNKSIPIGTLTAGTSKKLTVTGIPAGAGGTKYLRAFADNTCKIIESKEDNNQYHGQYRVAGVAAPDFVITNLSIPSVTANNYFYLTVTVKNQGTVGANAGYFDAWANQATAVTCGATSDGWIEIGHLNPGQSVTRKLWLPSGIAGTKTLRGFIDSWCETTESIETNNQLVKNYTVQ